MYEFPEKRPDEKVIRMLRRHKIFFLKPIFYSLIILLLMIVPFYFLVLENWLAIGIVALGIILIVGMFWYFYFLWKRDYYILTDQRIIDIDQNALFSRVFNEMPLDKIQDVSSQVVGLLSTVFNFGNVIIKTAGPAEDVVIEMISHPQGVTQEISTNFKAYREKKGLIKEEVVVNKNNPTPSTPTQATQGEQL